MSNKNPTPYTRANRSPSDAPSTGSAENAPHTAAQVDDGDDATSTRSFARTPPGRVEEINDEDEPPNSFHEESSASLPNSNKLGLTSNKGKTLMARKIVSVEEELSSRRPRDIRAESIDPPGRESTDPPGLGTSDLMDSIAGGQPTFFPVEATLVTDYDNNNHRPHVAVPIEAILVMSPPSPPSQPSALEVDQQPKEDSGSSVASHDAIRDSNHANEDDEEDPQTDEGQTVGSVPGQQQLTWLKLHKKLVSAGVVVVAGTLVAVIASSVGGGESESQITELPPSTIFPTPPPTLPPVGNDLAPCDRVEVNIVFDDYWEETSWDIKRVSTSGEVIVVNAYDARDHEFERTHTELMCLEEGQYRFTIYDVAGDGICCGPEGDGYYSVTSYGAVIAWGDAFGSNETTSFSINDPTCDGVEVDVNIVFDDDPEEITWDIQKVSASGDDIVLMTFDARKQQVELRAEHTESLCLEEGDYRFIIYDTAGDGLCCGVGHGRDGYYNVTSYGTVIAHGDDFRGSKSQTKVFGLLDPNCNRVDVNIVFDDYWEETSWDIKRVGASGNDYVEKTYDAEDGGFERTHTESMCLEEGQYRFTIYDDGGDGLCCGVGRKGYYNVTLNGTLIAQGNDFGYNETTPFNISDPTSLSSQLINQPSTAPTTTAPPSETFFPMVNLVSTQPQACPATLDKSTEIDSSAILYYAIVPSNPPGSGNGLLCGRLEAENDGWIGLAISENGQMIGSESIIGLHGDNTVLKYEMAGKSNTRVTAMSVEKQTLTHTSIDQEDEKTIMEFTKLLVEDGEIPILEQGVNIFLHARGDGSSLGFHSQGLSFRRDFSED